MIKDIQSSKEIVIVKILAFDESFTIYIYVKNSIDNGTLFGTSFV